MSRHAATLEFDAITRRLADLCLSDRAKETALALSPTFSQAECLARQAETTGAKTILESQGSPPVTAMKEIRKTLMLSQAEGLLTPDQLTGIATFINTCGRMKQYLQRAETIEREISGFGRSLFALSDLYEEIDTSIRGERVDDQASAELRGLRRKIEQTREQIKTKLESMLRARRECFSESFIVMRGERFALPVKKEHKQLIAGTVVDISSSGNTVFIEPAQARKLTDELAELSIAEENEVRRILYTLTAMVEACHRELMQNVECMETLDFLFAKARLSLEMQAIRPEMTTARRIVIEGGRHPLLRKEDCVPLDFAIGGDVRGVVITGPNTGGKTVALKTVGLLSLMAQSGLHVPAGAGSIFSMHAAVLCDIGDGQSIAENLSTFSSHMTNVIGILAEAGYESLVLLDELGSGTDPAEGMGLAVAILEELRAVGCLFVATSHYPEIKEFAEQTPGLCNARMTFDRESLRPLYRLEMGAAGESCALYIAERLGFSPRVLARARQAAYSGVLLTEKPLEPLAPPRASAIRAQVPQADAAPRRCDRFSLGDSVRVFPQKDIGIVCRRADEKGIVTVLVQGQKIPVNHKRLQLLVAAEELYPDDYDFSIVFDTVANRKARKQQTKGHRPEAVVRYEAGEIGGTMADSAPSQRG